MNKKKKIEYFVVACEYFVVICEYFVVICKIFCTEIAFSNIDSGGAVRISAQSTWTNFTSNNGNIVFHHNSACNLKIFFDNL